MRLWQKLKRYIVGRRYGASEVDSIKLLGYACRDYSNPVSEDDRKSLAAFESSLRKSSGRRSTEQGDDDVLNEQCQQNACSRADDGVYDRQPQVKAPIVRSIFKPLNFIAFVLGALFAHFVLGPLLFGS